MKITLSSIQSKSNRLAYLMQLEKTLSAACFAWIGMMKIHLRSLATQEMMIIYVLKSH